MRGVSLHHPSIYSSQPSRPSIRLSPPSLAPHQSHKAPHHSPWSTSTQPTPPSQIARMESEAIQGTETEKTALSSLFALCPVPCCWCCCLLCVKPIPPAHRRRPRSPTDDGHGPTECPTLDSDHGPRRPSAPSQILHRPPAAGLARWLLAHRYPTIRRRRRRPCSVKVLVQLLSEILPHLRHHSPAARLEAKSSDPSFASPSQSSRRHPSLRRSSP